jgi:SAM-dependent methyltransferase
VHAVNQITRRLIAVEQQVAPKELRSDLMRLESEVARIESLLAEGPAGRASAAAAQPEVMEAAPQGVYGLSYLRCNRAVGGALKDEMALYAPFVPLYVGQAAPVLDVGCGQGVFLRLLEQAGIPGRGVDVDAGMVAICREAGLDAEQGDVFGYLSALSDASLGGIFCAHVIEHLPRARLMELAALCRQKLADGAALVWITPHGGSLSPLHATFYKDIAHTRPLHPDLLAFVLEANGFGTIEVRTLSDMPPERKLEMLPTKGGDAAEIINRNLARLNELIFGHVDCAVIGRK